MIQSKACKGQSKAYGYEGACGKDTPVERRKYGLCRVCYWSWMQETETGKIHYQKQFLPKAKKTEEKNKKIKDKQLREKHKTITQLINEARKPFQKWIRIRDANRACISCGTTTSEIWDAGHYFKAELYSGLIFDVSNVHKQCRKCNTYLGGNEIGFRQGLVNRYGLGYVESMEYYANDKRTYKFTREELREIKKYYTDKIKQLT